MKDVFRLKVLVIGLCATLLLAACGSSGEDPAQVIKKFKQQSTDIHSGTMTFDVDVSGADGEDKVDFSSQMDVRFNRLDENLKKSDVNVALNGNLSVGGQALDGTLDFNFRNLAEDYYLQLNKLESSDPSITSAQPLISQYLGQWLHIAKDFIPADIRKIQEKDEATLAKEEELKKLFVDTDIFVVVDDMGEDSISGKKSHHYRLELSEAGVKDYIAKVAQIDERPLTDAEIDEAARIVSYFESIDFWIGSKDYYLYKASAVLDGKALNPDAGDMTITVDFTGADYNEDISVEVPADSREFNPVEILMGLSQIAPPEGEAAMTEGGE